MITRRSFFKFMGRLIKTGAVLGTYGFIIEPGFLLRTQYWALTPPNWTAGLKLRIVMLADPHLVEPHMPVSRWEGIVERANGFGGDLILLMGDYIASHMFRTRRVGVAEAARAAGVLKAPLGVYSINGNHDWWQDPEAQRRGSGPILTERAFADHGILSLVNRAVRLAKDGMPFWLSGTDSILAVKRPGRIESRADLAATLAQVTDGAPIIHLAHEPDLFVEVPDRVSLTLSGHTHGGQVRLFGYSPVTSSNYGNRFAYGHVVEGGRNLIVSGGLGCSIMPVRFGVPPEITIVDLG